MVKNSGELGIVEGLLYLKIVDIQENKKRKKKSCENSIENGLKLMFKTVTFLECCILPDGNLMPITYLNAVFIFFLLFLWFLQVFPFIVTVMCLSGRQG